MAEETNNQTNLTARQVAEQNPELNKFREIAFGTNYLDDIDAGTGTARFYSGFGQQPTYTGTNTDQSVADAVTAQAEAVAAPVQESGGQDQVTSGGITGVSGLPDNSMYGGDLDQGEAGEVISMIYMILLLIAQCTEEILTKEETVLQITKTLLKKQRNKRKPLKMLSQV